MFVHPHTFAHPQYVQQVLVGYLFCYFIKCFPTLEAVMGFSDLGGIHMPPMFIYPLYVSKPQYLWTPPYVWMPPICLYVPYMFGCPLYV